MKVDIAIITVREDEYEAVLQRFKPTPHRNLGGRTYGICYIKTKEANTCTIAITRCSEQGNDASQRLTHDIIDDLDPQLILVVGIAGGVPHDEFTLGDVIVSTRIHNLNVGAQHEDASSTFDIRGGIHPRVSDITSNLPLYKEALASWNEEYAIGQARPNVNPQRAIISGDDNWRKKVRASLKLHFGLQSNRSRSPKFKTGSIASSNHLVRNPLVLNQWLDIARTILAVEMEAAGVYEAAQGIHHQYPVMAIRGISDIIGLQRDRKWTAYACHTAAAFAYAFIMTKPIDPRMETEPPPIPSTVYDPTISSLPPPSTIEDRMVMTSSNCLRIFLCYSSTDKPIVRNLYQRLKSCNVDPWLDEIDLLAGQNWEYEIRKALRASDIVIICLSARSINKRGFIQKEIKFALDVADEQPEGTIFLIPLKLEECDIPERLKHLHCINLYEMQGFELLLRSLKTRASRVTLKSSNVHLLYNEFIGGGNVTGGSEGHENQKDRILHIDLEPELYGKSAARGIYDLVQAWPEGYDLSLAKREGRSESGASFLAIWDEKQAIVFDKQFQQLRQELWGEQSEQIENEVLQQMEDAKRAIRSLLETEGTSAVLAPYNAAPDTCEVSLQRGFAQVRYKDNNNLGIATNPVSAEVAAGSNMFARMYYKSKAQESYALGLLEIRLESQEQLEERFAITRAIVCMGPVYLASYAMDRGINPGEHPMARKQLTNLPDSLRTVHSEYRRLSADLTSGKPQGVS